MNNKGQLAGWEAVIILCLIIYGGFATYKWATKPSEANVYQEGSRPKINDIKVAPLSCVRVDQEKGWQDDNSNKTDN